MNDREGKRGLQSYEMEFSDNNDSIDDEKKMESSFSGSIINEGNSAAWVIEGEFR